MEQAQLTVFFEKTLQGFYQKAKTGQMSIKIPFLRDFRVSEGSMHWHFYPEIFFQYEGQSEIRLKNEKILLSVGDICIMPRAISHSEFAKTSVSKNIVVMISSESTSIHTGQALNLGPARMQEIIHFKDPNAQRQTEYLDDIIASHFSENWNKTDCINAMLVICLSHLFNLLKNYNRLALPVNQKIYRGKRYIMNNIQDSTMNVSKIAKYLGCSADYLSDLFHTEVGVPLSVYINQRKIQIACELLFNTTLDVNEISKEVGFNSAGYFIKVFKSIMGQTPKHYRDKPKDSK